MKKPDWAHRKAERIWNGSPVGADWLKKIATALRVAERRGYKQGKQDHVCSITDVQP